MRVAHAIVVPVALSALLAGGSAAQAMFKRGDNLVEACTPSTAAHNVELCLAYITGVADTIELEQSAIGPDGVAPTKTVCTPKGITNVEMAKVVLTYMLKNPQEHNLPAAALVANGLVKSYPCAG